jgi:hypothetical protein
MSGNTAVPMQSPSPLFLVKDRVGTAQDVTALTEQGKAVGLQVPQKDVDTRKGHGAYYDIDFKRFPNIGQDAVSDIEWNAAGAAVIRKLQNPATEEPSVSNGVLDNQMPVNNGFSNFLQSGLSVESILAAAQEFVMKNRGWMHESLQKLSKFMQEMQVKNFAEFTKFVEMRQEKAEEARQKARKADKIEVWRDGALVALGLVAACWALPATLALTGIMAGLSLAGVGLSFLAVGAGAVKTVSKYKKVEALEHSRSVEEIKQWGQYADTASNVEFVLGIAAVMVSIPLLVNWLRGLSSVPKIAMESIGPTTGSGVNAVYELQEIGTTARALTSEQIALNNDMVAQMLKPEIGLDKLPAALETVLKDAGWRNVHLNELEAMVKEGFQETLNVVGAAQSATEGALVSGDFMKVFSETLVAKLRSGLVYNGSQVQLGTVLLKMMGTVILGSLTNMQIGRVRTDLANSKYLVDELDTHIEYNRGMQQTLMAKAVRDQMERLQKSVEHTLKSVKNGRELLKQLAEVGLTTIRVTAS